MSDCPGLLISTEAARDDLSAPTGDDLLPAVLALLPVGAAWGTPDNVAPDLTRLMSRYWGAAADVMAEHYARLHQIKVESTTVTLTESLADWETELGLPDPCFGADQSVETRVRAVRAALLVRPIDSLTAIECLAESLGYTVTARRADLPFRVGSRVGDRLGDPTGACWVVLEIEMIGPPVYFRVGNSRVGDRLLEFPMALDLECVLDRLKPAEWAIRYDYSAGTILVEDSLPLTEDDYILTED